jgi:predicted dithiol-disulfide oxidoreductase (DUF899 family)
MREESANSVTAFPAIVDRAYFERELVRLRGREKAHTRERDAIAGARRRLPIVEADANTELIGGNGTATLLEAFEGRRQLAAYYFMWHLGHHPGRGNCCTCIPATSPTQCSVRVLVTKASATTTSWAGMCPGTQRCMPSPRSSLAAKSD